MTNTVCKLSHKEWRKIAKKLRRKKIRQHLAELRKAELKLLESSPSYQLQLEKQRLFEEYEAEKEAKEREEAHEKWLKEEERAQKQWREEQRLKNLAELERLKEQEKIREEWEKEQKKIKEEKEKLEALKREEEKRRQETLNRINDFIQNGGDIPLELQAVSETNPGKEMCLFFNKVGACRFGNQCSRNHQHFKISNTLLVSNFYSHFTLEQNKSSEYDTDIILEYEDSDMYSHFKEFYTDIVPEFKKFGDLTMVKVCCNSEPHLRGNVYIEYKHKKDALLAYKEFQGRWYGGKQLNIEFVKIKDWGGAVCGDFARRRCPKGKSCNFLHVFRNPKNEYPIDWYKHKSNYGHSLSDKLDDTFDNNYKRNWRWSESPESSPKRQKGVSHKHKKSKKKSKEKDSSRDKSHKHKSTKKKKRDKS